MYEELREIAELTNKKLGWVSITRYFNKLA